MRDEIAEQPAAAVTPHLPAFEPQPRRLVLQIPVHHHVPQSADRAAVQHCLGALPSRQLGKIEINDRGASSTARGIEHGFGAGEVGRERLLHEHSFAKAKRVNRDRGLKLRRNGDRNRAHTALLDQALPVAEPVRNVCGARDFAGARRVGPRQRHHLAARIGAKGRKQNGAPVIAADDADADHVGLARAMPRR